MVHPGRYFRVFLLAAIGLAMSTGCATRSTGGIPQGTPISPLPRAAAPDWRDEVWPEDYALTATFGEFLAPERFAPFAFDELIYSWNVRLPERQGFRLYLRVGFEDGTHSPWLYGGYWGEVPLVEEQRTNPTFERGRIEMDQLLLDRKARTWQFRIVDEGPEGLTVLPALHVIGTDNDHVEYDSLAASRAASLTTPVLDIPFRRQISAAGEAMPDRCQSAALASALEYYGASIPLDIIEPLCWDPEYRYPGIWPRTLGAGSQLGFDGYIDRFRDWDAVRRTLAMNRVILVSMRMPRAGDYIAPPYDSMGGHIVVLNGITDDGRVIVADSALGKDGRGHQLQWLMEDFEKVWMHTKGGVGMVVCPPADAPVRTIVPAPFPADRTRRR